MEKVFVDMDGVLCNFEKAYKKSKERNPGNKWPQMEYNFFLNLEPIEGSITAYKKLEEKYDIYILSSPSIHNPLSYIEKRLWVEKFLGFKAVDKLILTTHKELFTGFALIDDRPDLNGGFKGKIIHFGSELFPTWKEIVDYFCFETTHNVY